MSLALFGAAALNQKLVGERGSRARLETPAAVLDLDLFEHNIALMAETCRKAGLNLRPHAKSHKCAEVTDVLRGPGLERVASFGQERESEQGGGHGRHREDGKSDESCRAR